MEEGLSAERSAAESAQNVLVAGGLGFVGSHIVRALVRDGYRPVLFGPAMAEDRLADIAGRYGRFSERLD
ncbi:NAD dependent epimerase/dehydratase family protein OS=Bosea thiooxidans OX=53254 GN=ARD30_06585 PE=4 SV=1 [Bosea thiooxidans]